MEFKVGDVVSVTPTPSRAPFTGIVIAVLPDAHYTVRRYDNHGLIRVTEFDMELLPQPGANESTPHAKGVKHDSNKTDLALISPVAIIKIGQVMDFGAKKYQDHNWRKGMQWSRLLSACLRHTFAYISGEDKDPETGLSHLAHAACCLMFLLEYEETHKNLDNRFKIKGA